MWHPRKSDFDIFYIFYVVVFPELKLLSYLHISKAQVTAKKKKKNLKRKKIAYEDFIPIALKEPTH